MPHGWCRVRAVEGCHQLPVHDHIRISANGGCEVGVMLQGEAKVAQAPAAWPGITCHKTSQESLMVSSAYIYQRPLQQWVGCMKGADAASTSKGKCKEMST